MVNKIGCVNYFTWSHTCLLHTPNNNISFALFLKYFWAHPLVVLISDGEIKKIKLHGVSFCPTVSNFARPSREMWLLPAGNMGYKLCISI